MVGTRAMRKPLARQLRTRARTPTTVVTKSIMSADSETVFGRGVSTAAHRGDVGRHGGSATARAIHEIAHKARLAPGRYVEHIVQDQDLPIGMRPGTDADDRHAHALGDLAAQRG